MHGSTAKCARVVKCTFMILLNLNMLLVKWRECQIILSLDFTSCRCKVAPHAVPRGTCVVHQIWIWIKTRCKLFSMDIPIWKCTHLQLLIDWSCGKRDHIVCSELDFQRYYRRIFKLDALILGRNPPFDYDNRFILHIKTITLHYCVLIWYLCSPWSQCIGHKVLR